LQFIYCYLSCYFLLFLPLLRSLAITIHHRGCLSQHSSPNVNRIKSNLKYKDKEPSKSPPPPHFHSPFSTHHPTCGTAGTAPQTSHTRSPS
jgi:hypothetical protein